MDFKQRLEQLGAEKQGLVQKLGKIEGQITSLVGLKDVLFINIATLEGRMAEVDDMVSMEPIKKGPLATVKEKKE